MANSTPDLNVYVRDDLYETKQHGNSDYPLALYHVDSRRMHLELVHWHWHEEFEYVIVTSGTAQFCAADICYTLSAGDCLLINQNVLHRVRPHNDFDCTYYSVVFHPSIFLNVNNPAVCEKYLTPIASNPQMKFFVLKSTDEKAFPLMNLLKKIVQVNTEQEFGYELVTQGLLCQLWLEALNGAQKRTGDFMPAKDSQSILDEERIKGALTYIASHYSEPITLEDISDSVHISKSECCRCFKRQLHITPFEYLIKYRIYSASILVVQGEGKSSISEIALKTGFNSSSYFNKMFRKYIGCTPTEFRKKVGGNLRNMQRVLEEHIRFQDAVILDELISLKRP